MTPLNQRLLKKRDRTNENFDKYKHYQYTSSNKLSWPKTKAEMANNSNSKETTYPVPVTRTPPDFASRRSRVPIGCPSSTTCGPRGTAAEGSDAQHQDRSPEVDSQKVPVHVDAYRSYSSD
ncbi:hypothetical protein LY76DRAFT_621043 [Colletotrichum caudatum]|nr:hypothetical protein LY76DRAFT_621043 [Colletotrichum caudatum]